MLIPLTIECIGNPRLGFQPAWVKEVRGVSRHGMREFELEGQTDYSQANSVGSRGVRKHYFLADGYLYHVSSPQTFKRVDQYFCRVEHGKLIRMDLQEAFAWLQKRALVSRS